MGFTRHADLTGADLHGARIVQKTIQNFAQNQEITIEHFNDPLGSRIVQILEFVPGPTGLINSELDFDAADAARFNVEDPNGANVADGCIQLTPLAGTGNLFPINQLNHDLEVKTGSASLSTSGEYYSLTAYYSAIAVPSVHALANGKRHEWSFGRASTDAFDPIVGITTMARILAARQSGDPMDMPLYGLSSGGWGWVDGAYVSGLPVYERDPYASNFGNAIAIAVDLVAGKVYVGVNWGGTFQITWQEVTAPGFDPTLGYYLVVGGKNTDSGGMLTRWNTSQVDGILPTAEPWEPPVYTDAAYPAGSFYVSTNDAGQINLDAVQRIEAIEFDAYLPTGTSIGALISFDGRQSWLTAQGGALVPHSGPKNKTGWATIADLQAAVANLDVSAYPTLDFAWLLSSTDTSVTPLLDQVRVRYTEKGTYQLMPADTYGHMVVSPNKTIVKKLGAGTAQSVKINILT